jgi:hypothetical protein
MRQWPNRKPVITLSDCVIAIKLIYTAVFQGRASYAPNLVLVRTINA